MGWSWREEDLDLVLVPCGLFIMFTYHLFLLHRCLYCPHNTVIGYEIHNKKAWIEKIMQLEARERGLAISVLSSNVSAATSLSSISLALSSLIGAWIGGSSNSLLQSIHIYGDTRPLTISIKYIALLSSFLLAFASFVQTARHYVDATFLLSMPNSEIPPSYVEEAVIKGGNFWLIGIRMLYLAMNLLMWIFGPIPMFVSSVIMVAILYHLDKSSVPLIQYQPRHNFFEKVGQELRAIAEPLEHHYRPQHHGGKASTR